MNNFKRIGIAIAGGYTTNRTRLGICMERVQGTAGQTISLDKSTSYINLYHCYNGFGLRLVFWRIMA